MNPELHYVASLGGNESHCSVPIVPMEMKVDLRPITGPKENIRFKMNRFDARVACDSRDSRDPRSHFARFALLDVMRAISVLRAISVFRAMHLICV